MQAFIVVIPLKGRLSDNRFKFPKNFTRLGYFLISCCLATIICTILLFNISEKEQAKSESKLAIQIHESDSIHQQRIVEAGKSYLDKLDISNIKTITALAEYGLKYDTAQKRIERLVSDSTKKNTIIVQGNDPILGICTDKGIKLEKKLGDTLHFILTYCHKYSPANVKISLYALGEVGDKFKLISKTENYFSKASVLEVDGAFEIPTNVVNSTKSSTIFFYVIRTFTKQGGDKIFNYDDVYSFSLPEREAGFAIDNVKEAIKTLVIGKQ